MWKTSVAKLRNNIRVIKKALVRQTTVKSQALKKKKHLSIHVILHLKLFSTLFFFLLYLGISRARDQSFGDARRECIVSIKQPEGNSAHSVSEQIIGFGKKAKQSRCDSASLC